MPKNPIGLILVILSLPVLQFCTIQHNGYCYYGTKNIKVSENVIIISERNHINYCDMLRKSFKNDDDFSKFISLKFYDGSGIEHSDVVYQLYQYYGSEIFWKKSRSLSDDEKKLVQSYLDYAISENEVYDNRN